jgi:hypothetical protein
MQFDENDICPVDKLKNKTEGKIMILFLESEERRHFQDIVDIKRKVKEIKERFELDASSS